MKNGIMKLSGIASVLFATQLAFAGSHEMPKIPSSPQLEKLKSLVGTWKGESTDMEGGKVEVQYHLTSGGTAVVETISPDTPHEMTTVYYDEGGKLSMTHYCMLGNHPTMHLIKESATELDFEAGKGDLPHEQHMHALTMILSGPNAMEQRWSMFEHGKEGHVTTFKLERGS